ncbi:MAG: metallophosphoesterase [Clostridia bacterium]|nr:metallophosphoesterase [Clostridia bacterium]MBQ2274773.1 metallophosphoesterase [Clostridia bacterium]MBQ5798299.1 metallophosphoesterase [Clostridia bacterium]
MSLYAISDLHLSLSSDKPMDVFRGWENYVERLKANWTRLIKDSDTVVIPGDISWALKLEETKEDFAFLNSLPGKKIILKGNHDLWWSTSKKLTQFLEENNFSTISFVFNNAVVVEDKAVCGTRGWFYDLAPDDKVVKREAGRLEASITAAEKSGKTPVVFLHYPPVYSEWVCEEIFSVIKKHGIKTVWHGHIHGSGFNNAKKEFDGVNLRLLSADCVDFCPVPILL